MSSAAEARRPTHVPSGFKFRAEFRGETGMGDPPNCLRVMEALLTADSFLARQEKEARRRRRNPLYWLDRLVTVALRIPAYVLSRIIGVPVARIDESPFGVGLRVLTVVLDGALVYFAVTAGI